MKNQQTINYNVNNNNKMKRLKTMKTRTYASTLYNVDEIVSKNKVKKFREIKNDMGDNSASVNNSQNNLSSR
jgi:hypothetical protein